MNFKQKMKGLLGKELSIGQKRKVPGWLIALVLSILLTSFILFLAPSLFSPGQALRTESDHSRGLRQYSRDQAIVSVGQTGLYAKADYTEERICSLIFNELVTVLDKSPGLYWRVRIPEGLEGYVLSSDLDQETESVEPGLAYYKAMVLGREKRLYSHAMRGELVAKLPLGSILYADYRSQDLLRVKLPGGKLAWASTEDLLVMEPEAKVEITETDMVSRFISSLMAFHGAPRLPGQMTVDGADLAGAVAIAGRLNGLDLPRTVDLQVKQGEKIKLELDPETKLPDLSPLRPGDLVYFARPDRPDQIYDLACVMEEQIVLMSQVNSSTIGLWDLGRDEGRMREIAFVIRLFEPTDENLKQ